MLAPKLQLRNSHIIHIFNRKKIYRFKHYLDYTRKILYKWNICIKHIIKNDIILIRKSMQNIEIIHA